MAAVVAKAANPKPRDSEHRHRRKAKKGTNAVVGEDSKENADPHPHPQVEFEVEYVPEKADLDPDDPLLAAFTAIFEKFRFADPASAAESEEKENEGALSAAKKKGQMWMPMMIMSRSQKKGMQ